ncbi:MAG: RNA polymerase sporulation sigma factor SigG [Clostridiales bacterium]|jgi:RNA polymerase sporulation-specific sigma factor|nr:RNA polymerase sporulation sigma factor SigG [Clostridiales bacterium]
MIARVEICGVNTSKLPTLNEDQKIELFKKIKNGDKKARKEFINGNLRLVLSVLHKFNCRGDADDLFQVGCVGLIKALDNFDTSHNVKFSTYAVPMIIGEIRRYLRDNNSIKVSRSLRDIAYKALGAKEKLTNQNSKEPTITEISQQLGIDKEDIVFALESILEPLSLYEPTYNDSGDTTFMMEQVKDDTNNDESWIDEISLNEAMEKLNEKEKYILKLRFFEGKTQNEVAEKLKISQAQVSRLEKNAIAKMRKYIFA